MTEPEYPSRAERAETAADLRRAADLIGQHGHGKGTMLEPANGKLCLLGAIGIACQGMSVGSNRGTFNAVMKQAPAYYFPALPDGTPLGNAAFEKTVYGCTYSGDDWVVEPRIERAVKAVGDRIDVFPEEHKAQMHFTHIVYRYNDGHCDGGEAAQQLLLETADKLDADERIDLTP